MEKFGIFDFINKLSLQNNPTAKPPCNEKTNEKNQPNTTRQKKSNAYKATIALIKKHEEMSRRIDKNNR
jgi:hypothetical protein